MAVDRGDVVVAVAATAFGGVLVLMVRDYVACENGAGALPVGAAGADAVVEADGGGGVGAVGALDEGCESGRGDPGNVGLEQTISR